MTHPYLIAPTAEQDIEEIITYIAEDNPKAAYKFIDSLYASFDKLAEHPHMGYRREDLTRRTIKFWPFKWHYLIVYNPIEPLEIVRVLSGFRDIVSLL